MFRTIKKNILTPLLPKANEGNGEAAETKTAEQAADKTEVKASTANVTKAGASVSDANPQNAVSPKPTAEIVKKPPPNRPKESEIAGPNVASESVKSTSSVDDKKSVPQTLSAPTTPVASPTVDAKPQDVPTSPTAKVVTPKAAKAANTKPAKAAETKARIQEVSDERFIIGAKEINMANINTSMDELMKIDGAVGVAVVDCDSGMALGTSGGGGLNLEMAAAGNSEVVKAKISVRDSLGLKDSIDDILITLTSQYHLIRPLNKAKSLFIYLVLNRKQANLAMARIKLAGIEGELEI